MQFIYLMWTLDNWHSFKLGISHSPFKRAGHIRKSLDGELRRKPRVIVPFFFMPVIKAKFFEQSFHDLLRFAHAPWRGSGATEWFYLFALPIAIVLILLVAAAQALTAYIVAISLIDYVL